MKAHTRKAAKLVCLSCIAFFDVAIVHSSILFLPSIIFLNCSTAESELFAVNHNFKLSLFLSSSISVNVKLSFLSMCFPNQLQRFLLLQFFLSLFQAILKALKATLPEPPIATLLNFLKKPFFTKGYNSSITKSFSHKTKHHHKSQYLHSFHIKNLTA